MSSKVLTGDAALPVEQIVWRRLSPGDRDNQALGRSAAPAADASDAIRARIAELERDFAHREQEALRKGMEQGRAAGERDAAARLNPVMERFAATISDLAARRKQIRRDAEADVVKLSIAIARRVLRRELTADPDAMLGLVKAAIEKLNSREVERVYVNPVDVDAVRSHLERLRPTSRFEVVADNRLERGAAVFETARGSLDASVETQLEEIERGLIDRLRS